MSVRHVVGDPGELIRFVLTGVLATCGNITVESLLRPHLSFETAIGPGLATGFLISFILSKLFAFRSRSWRRAPGELVRFLIVYAIGVATFWTTAVLVGRIGVTAGFGLHVTELAGLLCGAGGMACTSYLGHRFFTYRTHQSLVPNA